MQIKTITKGNILLAQPALNDSTFNRTVVLITDHCEKGSIGFILNKPMIHSVNLFVDELESHNTVYEGGPVETENLYYLHSRPDLIANSEHICKNLYWSGDYQDVKKAINSGLISESEIRFYLGYSGWGKQQLENEVEDNAWIIVNEDVDIFQDWDNNLWKLQMKKLGGEHLLWLNTPADPSMN
ncbi:YqgE/AlgH family protein [Moheibacter stercoris]|uniref:Transcriptional regulator n=1 Tax=Moheibacter stercoris TaxID=1628251 RepID=A0ABV2LUH8_9FLAO